MSGRLSGLLAALVFFLIGSGQILLSRRLPGGLGLSAAEPGPGLFPTMVGALMCVAAIVYLFQCFLQRADDANESVEGKRFPTDIILLVLMIAAFILLLTRAGFVLSAFLLVYGTLSIYGMPVLWRRVVTAALTTAVSFLLFTKVLLVNFTAPTWFN